MWGRKDEAPTTQPETTSARPASPSEASRPASSAAARPTPSTDRSGRVQAQIGKALKLKGEMTGSEDVFVDGEVEGTVELRDNNLTVGPNGNVRAHVKAKSITVLGRLEGNVQAGERIEIRKTGSLEGDLVTPRIIIEDGAVFRGSIDILKANESQKAPAPQAAAPQISNRPPSRPPSRPPTPQTETASAAAASPNAAAVSTGGTKDTSGS